MWPLDVELLGHELYAGETGPLSLIITNTDCRERYNGTLPLGEAWDYEAGVYEERALKLKSRGFIQNYTLSRSDTVIRDGRIYAKWTLSLSQVCRGDSVKIGKVRLNFIERLDEPVPTAEELSRSFTLKAFDPVEFILRGEDRGSSSVLVFTVDVPSTLPSDTFDKPPQVLVTIDYGERGMWEYSYSISGKFSINPYRTFTLTVYDRNGRLTVSDAIVTLEAAFYPHVRFEFRTDDRGSIRIKRLPDFYDYFIKIISDTQYEKNVLVYYSLATAVGLARGEIRTELNEFSIRPTDALGDSLENAEVTITYVSSGQRHLKLSERGLATFTLAPNGNYSIAIRWKGVEVYSGYLWIGYHPTLNPSAVVPRELPLRCNVNDLYVVAVDRSNNYLPATFEILGPTKESTIYEVKTIDGRLSIKQMPVAVYRVRATVFSEVTSQLIIATIEAVPSGVNATRLELPIYKADVKVLNAKGETLEGAQVRLGSVTKETDWSGSAEIIGVPIGSHRVEVIYLGESVGTFSIRVPGDNLLVARVIPPKLSFLDHSGAPIFVEWQLIGPWGVLKGMGSEAVLKNLPDVPSVLTVRYGNRTIFESTVTPSLIDGPRRYPLGKMTIYLYWSDDRPLNGTRISVSGVLDVTLRGNVLESQVPVPFGDYNVSISYKGLKLGNFRIAHDGNPSIIKLEPTRAVVRVLDLRGQPLSDVNIEVRIKDVLYVTGTSDQNGNFVIEDLPTNLQFTPVVIARIDTVSVKAFLSGRELSITLPIIYIGILDTYVDQVTLLIIASSIPIMIAAYVIILWSQRPSKRRTT
ncbi:MAG: hypothetical protein NZ920_01165 [Aigarchaeota archaeon]|nr:hypothetical protein [Aigarchaeota archaeon]